MNLREGFFRFPWDFFTVLDINAHILENLKNLVDVSFKRPLRNLQGTASFPRALCGISPSHPL